MIIWIASYPKSGNTWMRLFIKSYFNSSNIKFSLDNQLDDTIVVESFPVERRFEELKINFEDFSDIYKNWLNMQLMINLNNKINYLKTHNAMCTINNHKFTNVENTLGAIYIVRDPRDVLVSYSYFLNRSIDEILKKMTSNNSYEGAELKNKFYKKSLLGSWSSHYNSWKKLDGVKTILVKYEEMIENPHSTFLKVLIYLKNLTNIKIDEKKINDTIKQTSFENLKNLELKEGYKGNLSPNPFFRSGKVGQWREKLTKEQCQKIEITFKNEMTELGYL